ncbi:hypothetical protein BpHYR1_030430, partial [Brachionus plicatilis]
GLKEATKVVIEDLFNEQKIKTPTQIQMRLNRMDIQPLPTVGQILTYIRRLKQESVPKIAKLNELFRWCQENEDIPETDDKMFCPIVDIKRNQNGVKSIRLFVTTKRLISLADHEVEMLAPDGTYKLIWQGYNILVVGSCDRNKAFHPFGVAI